MMSCSFTWWYLCNRRI